jgi:hypothetical protein
MRRDQKIKLMAHGLYSSRYTFMATSDVSTCYSCARPAWKNNRRNRLAFCHECWNRYFTRKSGGELEGMDYTREVVRIRDQHTCKGCSKVWVHGERRFDVHHLNGVCGKRSRKYEKISAIDGLITLCHKCHLNLESVRGRIVHKSSPRPKKHKEYQRKWRAQKRLDMKAQKSILAVTE